MLHLECAKEHTGESLSVLNDNKGADFPIPSEAEQQDCVSFQWENCCLCKLGGVFLSNYHGHVV